MAKARRSREEWRSLVERWLRSGISRAAFARQASVNPNTLAWWRWKLGAEVGKPAFLDVVLAEPMPMRAPEFRVEVGDVLVHIPTGFDAAELRRLVHALC